MNATRFRETCRATRDRTRVGFQSVAVAGAILVGFVILPASASAACSLTTFAELQSAFVAGGTVQLCQSISVTSFTTGENLTVGAGGASESTQVVLDLNGYSLTLGDGTIADDPTTGIAAIEVPEDAKLTIEDTSGGGSLTVYGGPGGAGIGGNEYDGFSPGTIVIDSGTVNATGGYLGPGIGGWWTFPDGALTVHGGTVNATAGEGAAGIGGGYSYSGTGPAGMSVVVDGGNVSASASSVYSAGIGGGGDQDTGGPGGQLQVFGGTITATGEGNGAGIGGGLGFDGNGGSGANVDVQAGSVTATGQGEGAGIGGGLGDGNGAGGAGGSLTVAGGTVNASAQVGTGDVGVGIGGGYGSTGYPGGSGATVSIDGGATVTASGPGGDFGGGVGNEGTGDIGAFGSLTNAGTLTLPASTELDVPSGIQVTNSGTIGLAGTLTGAGTVDNTGSIDVTSGTVADNGNGVTAPGLLVSNNNFALSFNNNGGSGTTPSTVHVYAPTLSAVGLSLPGGPTPPSTDTFLGWFPSLTSATAVTPNSELATVFGSGPVTPTLYALYLAPAAPAASPAAPSTSAPHSTSAPVLSGSPEAGEKLACSQGSWSGSQANFAYQWSLDGTPIVGATSSSYTVQTTDEGSTVTCTVTATNAAGSVSANSNTTTVPVPKVAGCPAATGSQHGSTLGLVKLGMTRAQAERAFTHSSSRGQTYEQFFCLTPIGIRVGYGSPKLVEAFPASHRAALKDRVVWISTSSAHYAIDGIRAGTTVTAANADKKLKLGKKFVVGLNDWYLASDGSVTAVFKARHGIIEEIGIAYKQLTAGRTAQRAFLTSFQ